MWYKYMLEAKEYDRHFTHVWKEDASRILVFVSANLPVLAFIVMTNSKIGLFSVIVGAFIIESYKRLSPDPSDKTTFLLEQISQQLSGLANGTHVQPEPYPPFSPDTRMIWVWVVVAKPLV
jgi:Family of unknown function (DUF6535)